VLSLGLAIAGLVLAVWSRALDDGDPGTLRPLGRLLRFPVFWAGLFLLGYVAVQALNPSWRYASDGRSWWIVPATHIGWLPSGIDAPFATSNAWRGLILYGTAWSLVCATWSGFLRRQSWRLLFEILAVNAALVALLGFLQRLSGSHRIFWTYLPSGGYSIASFIYRNHAGAYFNLMTALAAGLAWWHLRRAQRRLEGFGAAVFFAFLAFWTGALVIYSFSRAAVLLLLAFATLTGAIILARLILQRKKRAARAEVVVLLLALAGTIGIPFVTVGTESIWTRFESLETNPDEALGSRAVAREASGEMRRDRWLFGWGAGCFRYAFPNYARWHPRIFYDPGSRSRMYWEHAHDDFLEFPAELGALGVLPIVAMLAWGLVQLARRRFWRHPVSLCPVLGCLLLLPQACIDFVFQNPAVLVTSAVLFFGAIRWAELESSIPTLRRKAARV
jgi:O-antigen ligase